MNSIVVIVAVLLAFTAGFPQNEEHQPIESILNNERLLQNYINCVMDKGNCTPDATNLKKSLTEAFETGCGKCSESEKSDAKTVVKYLSQNKPEVLDEIVKKYDPKGIFEEKYKKDFEA